MADIQQQLADRFRDAISRACGDEHAHVDPLIRPSANEKFGDYQANVAMSLGKQLGEKPRDVAQRIVDALQLEDVCEKIEITGPGFINLHLGGAFLNVQLRQPFEFTVDAPRTAVVDYSGPNVAKEMHVGHLRSTVIGDAIARVLELQGHNVIRQNHLGDWGTQFGMLIERLVLHDTEEEAARTVHAMASLDSFYRDAKQRFDSDPAFADRSRKRVVNLQAGDEITRRLWQRLVQTSQISFQSIYMRLDVLLDKADIRAESSYNASLGSVIADLENIGLLKESQGAKVVFPEGFHDRDGKPLPLIVQKTDGGYLYATTDLAAARYRIDELDADRIVYVTDSRQAQHFAMVFATLRMANWASADDHLDHVAFGMVLGTDRKPFKTREGTTVKLSSLLDEAERRAEQVLVDKNPQIPQSDRTHIAHVIGIGALKYADLASDRVKDYVFDWDRMLSFDGNTAPYLINAYVRIRSIFRKAEPQGPESLGFDVREPSERALALKVLQLPSVVHQVAETLEPHRMCTYLYELASAFHQFYEQCPVLKAKDDTMRDSRLALCGRAAQTLKQGLDLLGIGVVEQM